MEGGQLLVEVGQLLVEVGQLLVEGGQLLVEVGQLLVEVGQLLVESSWLSDMTATALHPVTDDWTAAILTGLVQERGENLHYRFERSVRRYINLVLQK